MATTHLHESFPAFHFEGDILPAALPLNQAEVVNGKVVIGGLAESLGRAAYNGLVLAADKAVELGSRAEHAGPSRFAFTEEPSWREGREASAHDVRFGHMNFEGPDGDISRPVAVKIFEGDLEAAMHEYAATRLVRQADLIRTFNPVGLAMVGKNPALITDFEPQVRSFDNFEWGTLLDTQDDPDMLTAIIEKCALTLGLLHSTPVRNPQEDDVVVPSHGDARLRNMAWDQSGLRLVDLETFSANTFTVQPDGGLSEEDSVRLHEVVLRDLLLLLGSLSERGVLAENTLAEKQAFYDEHLLGVYRMVLRHPATDVGWKHLIDFDILQEGINFDLENFGGS